MSCGASIATRAGDHLRCILDDQHEGSCLPQLPAKGQALPAPYWSSAREPDFLNHVLAIVEMAIAGEMFTHLTALNFARALLCARLGIPERRK